MNKIICLVGESGSGKSTLAELLAKEGLKNIQSFTTRKPRHEGETGHIFTTEKQYQCNRASRLIIAETLFDGNRYWTTKGQLNEDCVYVIDPVGVKELKEKVKDAKIIAIYLKCDKEERHTRMMERAKKEFDTSDKKISNYVMANAKANERIEHDREAFKIVPCDFTVDTNRDTEEVLKDIKSIIDRV